MYHCETEDVTEKVFSKIGAKNQKENMIIIYTGIQHSKNMYAPFVSNIRMSNNMYIPSNIHNSNENGHLEHVICLLLDVKALYLSCSVSHLKSSSLKFH